MSKIDWSKAPEGATHYYHGSSTPWRDLSGEKWKWFSGNSWHCSGYPSSEIMDDYSDRMTEKPSSDWNGEGLPPAGIDVEFRVAGDERWIEGEVLYSSLYTVVISGNGFEHVHHPKAVKFRPVRTPEQIAAEKECAEIKELAMATGLRAGAGQMEVARAIYKAGYRKQVAK